MAIISCKIKPAIYSKFIAVLLLLLINNGKAYTQPEPLKVTLSSIATFCGGANGVVSAFATGGVPPYVFFWAPVNSQTSTIKDLPSGMYTVTVTDANGTSVTESAMVAGSSGPKITVEKITNVSCAGKNDGMVSVAVSGGNAPYVYLWNTGEVVPILTNVKAGTYTVNVKDKEGCVSDLPVIITEPAKIDTSVTVKGSTLTANAAGASYQWVSCITDMGIIPGATNQSFTAQTTGVYAVRITSANCTVNSSCIYVKSSGIEQPNINKHTLRAYPNPCSGAFTVISPIDSKLSIVDPLGQTVRVLELQANTALAVSLTGFERGVYLIVAKSGIQLLQEKIIILK